jgi:cytochrome c oxidase subunit 2
LSLLLALLVHVSAERFKYTPSTIEAKVGEEVTLEITSLDRRHGFAMPDFKIDETIEPGKTTVVHLKFDHAGTFEFHCSIFCGSGHEEMSGQFVVKE